LNLNFSYPVNLVFKREFLNYFENKLIFPLPFAAEKRYFKKSSFEKDIDISFLAADNNFLREAIKNILKNRYKNNSFTEHTGEISYSGLDGLPHENPIYFDILCRSKVAINVPGLGWDCGRYWEAISNKALVLTYKLDIKIPDPFIENKHILSFNNLDELVEKIDYCINYPKAVKQMSEEAYSHLIQFHTTQKRAEYLLNTIESNFEYNTFYDSNSIAMVSSSKTKALDRLKFSILSKLR
jgi:spore maturation protein CgeB